MIKHKDSHVDHGLTDLQLGYAMAMAHTFATHLRAGLDMREEGRCIFVGGKTGGDGGVTIVTLELPEWLGTVPCGLRGPIVGDPPITDDAVVFDHRGTRPYPSRLVAMPAIQTNKVTVIAGPHDGHDLVLYTAFGGPKAPREFREVETQLDVYREKLGRADTGTHFDGTSYSKLQDELTQSQDFWRTHALVIEAEPEFFTWSAEFSIHKSWVADGFDLTDDRAKRWLETDLGFAYAHEVSARVLKAPDADQVARTQGYKSAADRTERSKR